MPEPGITDRSFNRPTTDREKPRRRRPGGKRPRKPIKLPREYADFQLEDGRQAVEVLGESFFEPEAGATVFEGSPRFSRGPAGARRAPDHGEADVPVASRPAPVVTGSPMAAAGLPVSGPRRRDGLRRRQQERAEQELRALDMERAEKDKVREEARKKLPGVGRPFNIQEAYDRVDAAEQNLARLGREVNVEVMLANLGLEPVFRPDGNGPVDHFGARVAEYINGSRSERAGFRDKISFDGAASELAVTQDNFRIYLDDLDKRADIHDDSLDGDVRAGQAAVNARKRDARAALERERAATEARLNEFDRYADIETKRLRAEADKLDQKLSSDYGHMQNIADLPDDQQKIMKLIGENRAKATWLEQNLKTWRRQAEEDLANKEQRLRKLTGDRTKAPDVDPRSIADMDDAGLNGPTPRTSGLAKELGKARNIVAALEGVSLPSAVDRGRRDTLRAMVGIYTGENPPSEIARIEHNKTMRDFMAASPALREAMIVKQADTLMKEISGNGKRAVGAYTALNGKMGGLEAMNLPQLYNLKREIESSGDMGWHRKRGFVALVDKEIENSTYRGDAPRSEDGPEVIGTIYSGLASRAPETYRLPPNAITSYEDQREASLLHKEIARIRNSIWANVQASFQIQKELNDRGASQEEIDKALSGLNGVIEEQVEKLAQNRTRIAEIIATVPLSALKEVEESSPVRHGRREQGPPAPEIEGNAAEIEGNVRGLLKQKLEESPVGFVSFVLKNESFQVPYALTNQQIGTLAQEISTDAYRIHQLQRLQKHMPARAGSYDSEIEKAQSRIDGRVNEIASLVARYTSTEYEAHLETVASDKAERPLGRDTVNSWERGAGAGDVASGAHAMEAASGDMDLLDEMIGQRKGQDNPVVDMLVVEREIAAEKWLNAVGGIASGLEDQAEHPAGPALTAFRKAAREGDNRGMVDNFLLDPTMFTDMFVEGVATNPFTFGVGMAGSIIAAIVFPPSLAIDLAVAAGGSALDTAAAAYQQYGAEIVAGMKKIDVDFNDPDEVAKFWNNKENRIIIQKIASDAWKESALKNFVIGFGVNYGIGKVPGGSSNSQAAIAGREAVVHTTGAAVQTGVSEINP
jgi:hypothetical protein